jgi:beta-aspartyl-peptidase (threonine type)
MTNPVIITHGGAGGLFFPQRRAWGLNQAVQKGYAILDGGGSSLDAVEKAVCILEDVSIFNAGTGSTLGLTGEVEMDASIMTSKLEFGAVAAIKNVRNPIRVARLVMEKTDHMILGGEGAVRFARLLGIKYYDPKTREKCRMWQRVRRRPASDYFPKLKKWSEYYGTVGVVAIDRKGLICVGTSTGGISLHLPGRIGDTPVIGGGTYCDRNGGVSTTGHGEQIMKLLLAFRAVQHMERYPAPVAGRMAIDYASRAGCRCGIVGLDKRGKILCVQNTKGMSWSQIRNGVLKSFWDKV